MDFGRIIDHQKYEDLCRQLLHCEFPDIRVFGIGGRGGDEGTDSFTGTIKNQKCIFQFKYFPGKLYGYRKRQIMNSLAKSALNLPKKWYLLVPANLTPKDWIWIEDLKGKYPEIQIEVWNADYLEHLILKNQSVLEKEFLMLFDSTELGRKIGTEIYENFQRDLSELMLADFNISTFSPFSEFSSGSKECWKLGHFRIEDVKDGYAYRKKITDEVINSVDENQVTLISGRSHFGKSMLLKRILLEELGRGYVVLYTENLNVSAVILKNLIDRTLRRNYTYVLFIADNVNTRGSEAIFRVCNELRNCKHVKFLIASRADELYGLKASLRRDEAAELDLALKNMNKIDIQFSIQDAESMLRWALQVWDRMIEDKKLMTLVENLYDRSKGDPLIFTCAIIAIISANQATVDVESYSAYIERDFNEKLNALNENAALWSTALYCLFFGMFGIKLDPTLLKNCNIYADTLLSLKQIGLIFQNDEYSVRHERWAAEFLVHVLKNIFDNDYDSFNRRHNIQKIRECLSENLTVNELITIFIRCTSLSREERFLLLSKGFANEFPVPQRFKDADKADLYCFGFGNFLDSLKDHSSAKKMYEKAIDLNNNLAAAWNNLGNSYDGLQQFEKAEECYRKAIDKDPLSSIAYYNLSKILSKYRQFDDALKNVQYAIKLDSSYVWAYLEEGNNYKDLRRYDEAIASYKTGIKLDPQNSALWLNLASTYFLSKRLKDARFCIEEVEKINSEIGELWYLKGEFEKQSGNFNKARENYTRALTIDPVNVHYLNALGLIQLILNESKASHNYFKKVLKVQPKNFFALFNLSSIYFYHFRNLVQCLNYLVRAFVCTMEESEVIHVTNFARIIAKGTGTEILNNVEELLMKLITKYGDESSRENIDLLLDKYPKLRDTNR